MLFSDDGAGFTFKGFVEVVDVSNDSGTAFLGKFDGGFDFGKHGTWLEVTVFDKVVNFCGGDMLNWLLVGSTKIDVGVRNSGD